MNTRKVRLTGIIHFSEYMSKIEVEEISKIKQSPDVSKHITVSFVSNQEEIKESNLHHEHKKRPIFIFRGT